VPRFYWEDFTVGETVEYGPRRVTREEIVAFAAEFDPQPFHLDEDAGRTSMLGGLSASGWHTCAILMRMIADGYVCDSSSMGGPGVEELKWLRPVRPDDQLTVRRTPLEKRTSQSRPEMGIVKFLFELFNQHGECVLTMTPIMMFGRREAMARARAEQRA
jgi:acyl dehydratase